MRINNGDLEDFRLFVERLYNEYLEKTENRKISYGEFAYIQGLSHKSLEEFYDELIKERESANI